MSLGAIAAWLAHTGPHPHRANQAIEAIIAGASGYILKTAAPKAIISAVKDTAAGESVLSSQIAGKLLERIRELDIPIITSSPTAASPIRAALTERELEIFRLLASGKSNQDIGRQLSLSTNTIRNHIKSILAKLQLENRIQAAVQAIRTGISYPHKRHRQHDRIAPPGAEEPRGWAPMARNGYR